MSDSDRRLVLKTVDAMRDEIVQMAADFVRVPTVNPPGENYREFSELFAERARDLGLEARIVEVPGSRVEELGYTLPRVNAVAGLKGENPKPELHMNGHFDVVPAGSGWTVDPFGGEIRQGRLYGRGSSDMKGGLAAQLMAAAAIKRAGIDLGGTLSLSATCDEETGGQLGAGYLVEEGYVKADMGINSDSGPVDTVSIGHRGVVWVEITTKGRAAHGSRPHKGINAVEQMADVIQELKKYRKELAKKTSAMPIPDPLCRHPTITIGGTIRGGVKTNVIPDRCVMTVDRRVIWEETPEEASREIEGLLARMAGRDPEFRCETRVINVVEPSYTPEDSEIVEILVRNAELVTGRKTGLSFSAGYTDMWYFSKIMPMAHYGVCLKGQAHAANECLDLEDLVTGTKVLALAAVEVLGG